jgi:hypothetical protein
MNFKGKRDWYKAVAVVRRKEMPLHCVQAII